MNNPRQAREEALHGIDLKLAKKPGDVELRFEQARLLTALGRDEAARDTYLALLRLEPAHFGALNNLGTLLHGMGYRSAAHTVYAQAVALHPGNPMGQVNLANMLRETGDPEGARKHYEAALAASPDHAPAHQGLAGVFADLDDEKKAAHHRALGFKAQPMKRLPYRGENVPRSLLLLVSAIGGDIPVRALIDDRVFETSVIYADYWDKDRPLPAHDLIFNAIGDADLCASALEAASRLIAGSEAPIVNRPDAVLRTGRVNNAARLAHLPDVRTARTRNFSREALCEADAVEHLAREGFAFPLLLRTPGFHAGQHFLRVKMRDELISALAALPGETLTIIEYMDARIADGLFRKYRVMFVDGEMFPLHMAVSQDWKVHYFTADMAARPEHRAAEALFLDDMAKQIGARAMTALARIRGDLGLDYGGIDFSLGANGEILLFEANATIVVNPPDPDPRWDYRRAAVARIHTAVHAMLARKAGA